MHTEKLAAIARSIVNSESLNEQIDCAKNLAIFYKEISGGLTHSSLNETKVKGGIALSSQGAADCVEDYLRTIFFIKGTYQALTHLFNKHEAGTINILYAGSGPYATLLLPLLPLFDSRSIKAILLDINQSSLDCLENIIEISGLNNHDLNLVCADATTYIKPDNFIIDLCISETMHYALTSEPQVAIIKNLASQISPDGILIPKEIITNLALTFFANEPYLRKGKTIKRHNKIMDYPSRIYLGKLFAISKDNFPDDLKDGKFESIFYNIPEDFSNCPDVCIFTEVEIIEGISLKMAESFITNPFCVASLSNFKEYEYVRLVYDFNEIPKWYCDFK